MRIRNILCAAIAVLCMLNAAPARCAEQMRVAVLPFFTHSETDMSYLQQAIPAMLASRLEETGEITVVDRPTVQALLQRFGWDSIDEEKAAVIGSRLRANFVITGNLTCIGRRCSIDAVIINATEPGEIRRAHATADDADELTFEMSGLAARINHIIFDKVMVADVQTRGNVFIEQDAILFAVETRKGRVFSPQVLQEDLRRIYQMGYFKDIQITTEETERGMVVVFILEEKPLVRSVQITGNKKIKLDDLVKVMHTKVRTILDVAKVKADVNRMRKVYVDKGYYDINIRYTITPIDDDYSSVEFRISEGETVKVAKVTFSGNHSIPDSKLKKVMETRKKHWLMSLFTSRGIFKDDALEKDAERIGAYYYSQGFLQANVHTPQIEFKGKNVYVHFSVDEGDRFSISSLDFTGDLIYETDFLLSKMQSTPGATFNGQLLNDDLIALKTLYSSQGFAFADITPLTELQVQDKTVKVVFDIYKGDKIYIEKINVSGNTRTRDNVIRREMRLVEGEVYNSIAIDRSRMEINKLGFFEDVLINTEPGSAQDQVNLGIEVKERPTGAFSIGAGYSSADSVMGMFQISQNNLFGKGQQLTFMAQIGGDSSYYNISFTEPWFRDRPQSVGFDLFKIEREYEDFDRESSGLNLRTSFPFQDWDFTRMHITYRFESIDIKLLEEEKDCVARDIAKQEGSNTVSSIITALVKDSRDDNWAPREGVYNSASIDLAGFGGDSRFISLTGSAAKYFPVLENSAFMIRGTIGQIFPFMGKGIPLSEKFFLGGMGSLRGFEPRSVGPRDPRPCDPEKKDVVGGKKQLYFNFEYLFPLMKEAGVRGMLFFDTGNAYGSGETFFSDMRNSVGVGVNWYSPFGPLSVVWGINLSPKYDEDSSNFEFSMGGMF
jgi:outer membrane protein insertion porin family